MIDLLGLRLYEAERSQLPIEPLTDTYPNMTLAEAYAVQKAYARLRQRAGAKIVGQKIGATSRAIQELFDIDTPDFGHLFDDMRHEADGGIRRSALIEPMVEPEIGFVLDEEVKGPGCTPQEILNASNGVVACLEVIDSRIEGWRIKLADTVADNGSSARFVLGSKVVPVDGRDLAAEAVTLECNGEVVASGTGAEVLGHPAEAASWLANAVGDFGMNLPAGSIVLSGSMTSAVAASAGDRFTARFSSLGEVSCEFE